ncbi:Rossmann fold nucleotide-binding protein [Microbacterium paludicola]|uniref:Rossmann fold nucleotide-binding protein n=1 Tax=Microbacterium paludicola TaxID=300019 RepID=A0A4Y9FYF6_9MICO|nr:Rossmann fold nucleotide-binding protein [Microbacterium paludicola]MBF0815260.1 Rossmann fold nucleotide-binding protein [Microbacterium paludicola]TFU34130.1 Rossmann fold nucleotide-binding protein [Microbacterium paludicola]
MKHRAGRIVTIESLTELDRRLAQGAHRLRGWRLVGLDLRERGEVLADRDTSRTTFAGCTFAPRDAELHEARGALVLPAVDTAPVDPNRDALYTADELYDDMTYRRTLDGRAYAWSQGSEEDGLLARALHDDGIDRALTAWTGTRRLVGVMGGHALRRGEDTYADAARMGKLLGARFTVATGGGPGAMEAANLGARLARAEDDALAGALEVLATAPSYHPSIEQWIGAARTVLTETADAPPTDTLGVPTWHYGHEPPNLFATAIAKYFRNALREAILLQVCESGIVFLPGAGGTVQEIFQDACENYYATEDAIAPMVLVGRAHWTETLPAWPLLQALAKGRPMERHIHLVETVDEAAAIVLGGAA